MGITKQNIFHRAIRRFLKGGIDGGNFTILFRFDGKIHQREIRSGNADGEAVDFALELR
ncbi:MAG: hypothetical protein RLZZ152_1633 [Pseudomonadota bacterium]